jgi:DNA-binding NtrC family response regulator
MSQVLIVEDERGVREGLGAAVERLGHQAVLVPGIAQARDALSSNNIECVLLDIRLKDGDGLSLLKEMRGGAYRDIPVIVASAYGDSERTIAAMRDGAFEYLTKPFDLPEFLATVDRAIRQLSQSRGIAALSIPPVSQGPLVGSSAAMHRVWKVIGRAAASSAPVLITGETGTGKELVAQAIHKFSSRSKNPFVAVNLPAIPPSLIESELMGHEKGSFTGAVSRHIGKLEQAGEGTLFLDEIGDLDLALQAKLLRVLQDGSYERVGGSGTISCNARVVAATNKPVRPSDADTALREELYYRLAVIEIDVPPLRDRRSDIPVLVAHALEDTPARAVSEEAMAILLGYSWPGNVRELMHVIKRASVMCGGEIIDVTELPEHMHSPTSQSHVEIAKYQSMPLREAVASFEKELILAALERSNGNRAEAARQLGIARPQLYAKMMELGIATRQER